MPNMPMRRRRTSGYDAIRSRHARPPNNLILPLTRSSLPPASRLPPVLRRPAAIYRASLPRLLAEGESIRPRARFFHNGHWHSGNLHLKHAKTRARAEIDGLPVVATEGDVRRVLETVHYTAKFLACRTGNIKPAGAPAVDIASRIHLHPVGHSGLRSAQVGKNTIGLARQRTVRLKLEGADVTALGTVDVEHVTQSRLALETPAKFRSTSPGGSCARGPVQGSVK